TTAVRSPRSVTVCGPSERAFCTSLENWFFASCNCHPIGTILARLSRQKIGCHKRVVNASRRLEPPPLRPHIRPCVQCRAGVRRPDRPFLPSSLDDSESTQ